MTIGNTNSGDITFSRTDAAAAAASGNAGDLAYIFGGSATFKSGGGNDAFQLGAGDTTIKNTTSARATLVARWEVTRLVTMLVVELRESCS